MNALPLIPGLASASSTRDAIIRVLSDKWPLTARGVYLGLQLYNGREVSYQAVHKMLRQLVDEGIISARGRSFELSDAWISKSKQFFDGLTSRYAEGVPKLNLLRIDEQPLKLHFDDPNVFATSMAELLSSPAMHLNQRPNGIASFRHAWWPLDFKFPDFALILKMMSCYGPETTALIRSNTPFDHWAVQQYRRGGMRNTVLGCPSSIQEDIATAADFIVKVRMSEDTLKLYDEVYGRVTGLTELFAEFIRRKLSTYKVDIQVTVIKDATLARAMQNELWKEFEAAKQAAAQPGASKPIVIAGGKPLAAQALT